jgi:hypothetical protein
MLIKALDALNVQAQTWWMRQSIIFFNVQVQQGGEQYWTS